MQDNLRAWNPDPGTCKNIELIIWDQSWLKNWIWKKEAAVEDTWCIGWQGKTENTGDGSLKAPVLGGDDVGFWGCWLYSEDKIT